jgi:hypothetical protein
VSYSFAHQADGMLHLHRIDSARLSFGGRPTNSNWGESSKLLSSCTSITSQMDGLAIGQRED